MNNAPDYISHKLLLYLFFLSFSVYQLWQWIDVRIDVAVCVDICNVFVFLFSVVFIGIRYRHENFYMYAKAKTCTPTNKRGRLSALMKPQIECKKKAQEQQQPKIIEWKWAETFVIYYITHIWLVARMSCSLPFPFRFQFYITVDTYMLWHKSIDICRSSSSSSSFFTYHTWQLITFDRG